MSGISEEKEIEVVKENSNMGMKLHAASVIRKHIKEESLSIRRLGDIVGLRHPQIHRVLNGENYNVDTLFKILNGLNLEIEVRPKTEEEKF